MGFEVLFNLSSDGTQFAELSSQFDTNRSFKNVIYAAMKPRLHSISAFSSGPCIVAYIVNRK